MDLLLGWLIAACVVAVIAGNRGRNVVRWFIISLLASPLIAIILVPCLPNVRRQRIERYRHGGVMRMRPGNGSPVEAFIREAKRHGHGSPVTMHGKSSAGQSALKLVTGAAIVIGFLVFAALSVVNIR
jgi:hypothetical protein